MYGTLADIVVVAHLAYVGYVVLGQLAIVAAAPFRAAWARNPWFRFTHLAAIGYVAFEEFMGLRCPLTIWEEKLRVLAGGTVADVGETFMGRLAHNILFTDMPPIFFATVHVAFAAMVFQGFIMYPPRWFRLPNWIKSRNVQSPSSPITSDFITSRSSTVA